MTLRSFPKDIADGQVFWFIDEKDLDSAFSNNKGKEALLSLCSDLIIVQVPLSRLTKIRSPQLAQLENNGLAKKDRILVMCDDLKVENKYVDLETLIEDFLKKSERLFQVLCGTRSDFF